MLGVFSGVTAIGLTLGPISVAALYERAGQSYYPAFGLLVVLMLSAATAVYFVKPKYRLQQQEALHEAREATT